MELKYNAISDCLVCYPESLSPLFCIDSILFDVAKAATVIYSVISQLKQTEIYDFLHMSIAVAFKQLEMRFDMKVL